MTFVMRKGAFRRAHGQSTHAHCVRAMIETSRMELYAKKDSQGLVWMLLRCYGTCAALPSTTNSRLLTVPRHHVLKQLNSMLQYPGQRTHEQLKKLINDVRGLRAFITKSPEQKQQLEALTHLYVGITKGREIKFNTEPKKRAIVLMMLSPDLNRHDSHNIPKAVCDWLQDREIISNDRHVDAFGRRKSDHGIKGQSSDIFIMRYGEATASVESLLSPMMNIISEVDKRNGHGSPIQTPLNLDQQSEGTH